MFGCARSLWQIPLSVLALGAEVRSGLWRRNGHMMMDQVVNYADAPFCRIFKDMDILLLQCAGAWDAAATRSVRTHLEGVGRRDFTSPPLLPRLCQAWRTAARSW
jgi:hypothetical protein